MCILKENFSHMSLPVFGICGLEESAVHIYTCKVLNSDDIVHPYEDIFLDDMKGIKKVHFRMKKSMEKREEYINICESTT